MRSRFLFPPLGNFNNVGEGDRADVLAVAALNVDEDFPVVIVRRAHIDVDLAAGEAFVSTDTTVVERFDIHATPPYKGADLHSRETTISDILIRHVDVHEELVLQVSVQGWMLFDSL